MDRKHLMEVLENVPEYEEDYPHDHLYDRNLTLVNLTNFKFLINSDICNVRRVSLVTIIHSASQNTEARAIIRWELYCLRSRPIYPNVVRALVTLVLKKRKNGSIQLLSISSDS